MSPDQLSGSQEPNPFRDTQARDSTDDLVRREFIPTSTFGSLFTSQHEILIGTRGSGKTALLRMMSFTNLLKSDRRDLRRLALNFSAIAFYVPLNLEVMSRYFGTGAHNSSRKEYFQFAVNCMSAVALIRELKAILSVKCKDVRNALAMESILAEDLTRLWLSDSDRAIGDFADLEWEVTLLLRRTKQWNDGELRPEKGLVAYLLVPIVEAVKRISTLLEIDLSSTQWIVCLDEAEFLDEAFLTCVNSFMRSSKRPLALKMATLPFKHVTLATDAPGVQVHPNGDDFDYREVDMDPSHRDFRLFTNSLVHKRLSRIGVSCNSLEDMLKIRGNDDPVDHFKANVAEVEGSSESILSGILDALSGIRRENYALRSDSRGTKNAFLKRFGPVYYVRKMRSEDRRGGRKVSWFVGANTVRNISDGNPRRFLQLMNDFFERARSQDLTYQVQHDVAVDFAKEFLDSAPGLPESGPLVRDLLEDVGLVLFSRVHGFPMVDGGCSFTLTEEAIREPKVLQAVQLACQFTHMIRLTHQGHEIHPQTIFRLSFIHAVNYWLPMRRGDNARLGLRQLRQLLEHEEDDGRIEYIATGPVLDGVLPFGEDDL